MSLLMVIIITWQENLLIAGLVKAIYHGWI